MSNLREQLIREEGCVLHVYLDSRGKRTIGIGHCLDTKPIRGIQAARLGIDLDRLENDPGYEIAQAQADALFAEDLADVDADLRMHLPWFLDLNEPRRGVLEQMCFQMGAGGLLRFKLMLAAVQAGDWLEAGRQMEDSVWWHQTNARARRLRRQMEEGAWA